MSPQAQHIVLLTAMGWTSTLSPSNQDMEDARLGRGAYVGAAGYPIGGGPGGGMQYTQWTNPQGTHAKPPDFTLDMMATLEAALTDDQWVLFNAKLAFIVGRDTPHEIAVCRLSSASKEQRREAYLKTRGLWV